MYKFLESWVAGGNGVSYTPAGLAWFSEWGPLRYTMNAALIAEVWAKVIASKLISDQASDILYLTQKLTDKYDFVRTGMLMQKKTIRIRKKQTGFASASSIYSCIVYVSSQYKIALQLLLGVCMARACLTVCWPAYMHVDLVIALHES